MVRFQEYGPKLLNEIQKCHEILLLYKCTKMPNIMLGLYNYNHWMEEHNLFCFGGSTHKIAVIYFVLYSNIFFFIWKLYQQLQKVGCICLWHRYDTGSWLHWTISWVAKWKNELWMGTNATNIIIRLCFFLHNYIVYS